MSTSEQDMDNALNDLDVNQLDVDNTDNKSNQEIPDNQIDVEPTDNQEKPPGFITYDEWIEKGRDPADFRGENAYKAQYESLKEVRELKSTMSQVVESMETWKQQQNDDMDEQIEQARIDAEADLNAAKEEDDMQAALDAQAKITKLENRQKAQPTSQINPAIRNFASKNPIVDSNSTQYNAEFHQDMITINNNKLDQLLGGDRSKADNLTSEQVTRVQNWAFNQAKELHPEKFVSPKNRRAAPSSSKQRTVNSKGDVSSRLKNVTGNTKNRMDANPANDIYEILKSRDPDSAERFAKNILGDE